MACPNCGSNDIWDDNLAYGCNKCGFCNLPGLDTSGYFHKIAKENGAGAANQAAHRHQSISVVQSGTGKLIGRFHPDDD